MKEFLKEFEEKCRKEGMHFAGIFTDGKGCYAEICLLNKVPRRVGTHIIEKLPTLIKNMKEKTAQQDVDKKLNDIFKNQK